jgi:hypothetical protein
MTDTSGSIRVARSYARRATPLTDRAAATLLRTAAPDLILPPEWLDICAHRCNTLLIGPADATARVLMLLRPYLRRPTVWAAPQHGPLEIPIEGGTVVLQEVSALGPDDQAALLKSCESHRAQLISTSATPLFPLIALGVFDEALYYRLNVMLMSVAFVRPPRSEETADLRSSR